MLFSDRPSITLYSVYKNNQLRLPSLYAMIILLLFYVTHILCSLFLFSTLLASVSSFVFKIHACVSCYLNSIHFVVVVVLLLHYSLFLLLSLLAHGATSPCFVL